LRILVHGLNVIPKSRLGKAIWRHFEARGKNIHPVTVDVNAGGKVFLMDETLNGDRTPFELN
jgi:hypothetical protein